MRFTLHRSELVKYLLEEYEGGGFVASRSHARKQPVRVVLYAALTLVLGGAAGWAFAHPGAQSLGAVGGMFLASAGAFSLMGTLVVFGFKRPENVVRWVLVLARVVRSGLVISALGLGAVSATLAIGVALYSVHIGEGYDIRPLRVQALEFALMATGLGIGITVQMRRDLIDVVRGRVHRLSFICESVLRVLVIEAWFTSVAVLVAPGSSGWILTAAALSLTAITWEIGRRSVDQRLIDAFTEAATEVQSASAAGEVMLGPLLHLEAICRRRFLGGGRFVNEDVVVLLRACVERLEPWERHDYRAETSMHVVQQRLMQWDDDKVRVEIGRLATALRRAVVLRRPIRTEPPRTDGDWGRLLRRWSELWFGVQDVRSECEHQPNGQRPTALLVDKARM